MGSVLQPYLYHYPRSYIAILYDPQDNPIVSAIIHTDKTKAIISLFACTPAYRKKGLGRVLNAFLVEHCIVHDLHLIVLSAQYSYQFWTQRSIGYRELTAEEKRIFGMKGKRKCGKQILSELIFDGRRKNILNRALNACKISRMSVTKKLRKRKR